MSRNVLPAARQASASSATQSGDNVADVMSVDDSAEPAMIPSSPSHTDRDEASSAVASNTTSASAAAAAGVGAAVAPAATTSVVRSAVRFQTATSWPLRSRLTAIPAPITPVPIDGDPRHHQNDGPTVTVTGGAAPNTSAITRLASSSVTCSQRASCSSTLCTLPSVISIPPRRLIRAAVSSRPSW